MSVSYSKYIVQSNDFSLLLILSNSLKIEDTIVAQLDSSHGSTLTSICTLNSNSYYNQHYS
jgi:hypothetical protein